MISGPQNHWKFSGLSAFVFIIEKLIRIPLKNLFVIFEKFNIYILALCGNISEIMGFRFVVVGSMPL